MRIVVLLVVSACGFPHGAAGSGSGSGMDDAAIDSRVLGMPDASDASTPPPEGSVINLDTIIEAENYTLAVDRGTHAWNVQSNLVGHSGTGYTIVLPNDGVACVAAITTTCSEVQYAVNIAQQGTYYVHARMLATNSADDSVWYGLDGTPEASAFAPMTMYNQWHWLTSASFALTAGNHTLSFWYRETGIRLDVVAVTTSATPPP